MAAISDSFVFLSGLRGIDPATERLVEGERERIGQMFENLRVALEGCGSSLAHVVSTRVYVTDMARHRPLINEMYEAYFAGHYPARTIVEVSGLNQGDIAEIEAVAVRIGSSRSAPSLPDPDGRTIERRSDR